MPQRFYTIEETRALLGGISETTLWRLRKRGKIKNVLIANRPMFAASQIDAYQRALLGEDAPPTGADDKEDVMADSATA